MAHLEMSLFGTFSVKNSTGEINKIYYDKLRAFLTYLVIENQYPIRREKLATLLWPDHGEKAARSNLRLAILRLRNALLDHKTSPSADPKNLFLLTTKQTVQFNANSDYTLDVQRFQDLITASENHHPGKMEPCAECTTRLEEAIMLYKGELLLGLNLNSTIFTEWLEAKRNFFRHRAIGSLFTLISYKSQQKKYPAAIRYSEILLGIEPWAEDIHRYLMYLLCLVGQHRTALQHYEQCSKMLFESLNVVPSSETKKLYQEIERVSSHPENLSTHPMEGITPIFIIPPIL